MTQESILGTLLAYKGLVEAHEEFDFLLAYEFPDERRILLLPEVVETVRGMPRSPSGEDPHVSSREQVMALFRNFMMLVPMRAGWDYEPCDQRLGLWKWKTRTVRLVGIYCGGVSRFVVAKASFARDLKHRGKANTAKEKEFAAIAAANLQAIGLLGHAWIIGDPHDGETIPFDPD